uniref:Uncharacterized protein n=1 Tax=Arundo donax TaxID=35708 RepID=A0A0A8YD22_ARUDO
MQGSQNLTYPVELLRDSTGNLEENGFGGEGRE